MSNLHSMPAAPPLAERTRDGSAQSRLGPDRYKTGGFGDSPLVMRTEHAPFSCRNQSEQIYANYERSQTLWRDLEKYGMMVNKTRALPIPATVDARDKAGRREEFLAVALKLFSEHEYSAVTIKAIAAEAGVNPALLYYYYKDKEDLFRATLEHAVAEAMTQYAAVAASHLDPVELIDGWFEMHAKLASKIRRLVKILMDYSISGSESRILDDIIAKFYDEETRILSAAIRHGQKEGLFRNVNARKAAQFASTHLDGIMARSHIEPALDIRGAVNVLREVFWVYLGHSRGR